MTSTANYWETLDLVVLLCRKYLNPVEIAATNRSNYTAASARVVWLDALDRICSEHGIFKGTYPLEKMSVKELEHAASGPHRFIKSIKSYPRPAEVGDYTSTAFQVRSFKAFRRPSSTDTTYKPFGTYELREFALVPGGRFLLTCGKNGLCLWDLGYSMYAPAKPYPISSIEGAKTQLRLHKVAPSADGKHIIIATTVKMNAEDKRLVIFGIDPLARAPQFVEQGRLVIATNKPRVVHFDNRLLLGFCRSEFVAWDWSSGTGRRWTTGAGVDSSKIFLCKKTAVALIEDDFTTWEIPDLLPMPLPSFLHIAQTQVHPKIVDRPGKPDKEEEDGYLNTSFYSPSTPWQTHFPPTLGILCSEVDSELEPEGPKLCIYSFRDIAMRGKSKLPASLPILNIARNSCYDGSEKTKDIYEDVVFQDHPSELFYCDGHLVFCSRTTRKQVLGTVLKLSQDNEVTDGPISALLSDLPGWKPCESNFDKELVELTFCPMSGRMVSLLGPGYQTSPELYIHDYLIPLEEPFSG